MNLIVAMIRAEKLEQVRHALLDAPLSLMYASEVQDVWRQTLARYRGHEYRVSEPRLRLEIVVVNEMATAGIVDAIVNEAFADQTGPQGNGDIFVMQLNDWIPIRPGVQSRQVQTSQSGEPTRAVTRI